MRVTKRQAHHISMGNFEWVEFAAEVTVDSEEFPKARNLDDLNQIADDFLAEALAPDIEEALLNTAEPQSYIHLYKNDDQENS